MYDETSDQGPKGTFETYKAEGDALYKQGEYRKAIESYTTALELKDGDRGCLVARSKCFLQLGDTDKALEDAESCLEEDKEFHKGLYQKAEALYYKGDFEMALVFYHRGHKLRPELQEFRLGIQKAQEAIDNSVGSPAKVKLEKKGDLSFFAKQDEKARPKKTYGYQKTAKAKDTKREIPKVAGSEKTVKQLLGELYGDKVYLDKLLRDPAMDYNTKHGRVIQDLATDAILYLDTRTEFWRQQKPIYARKRDKMEQSKRRTLASAGNHNQYVLQELECIDQLQAQGKFKESLKRAVKCLKQVEDLNDDDVSKRQEVIGSLHSSMGNAHLELGNFDKALNHHQKDLDIATEQETDDAKSRALDNMGRVYARSGNFAEAVEVWEAKLPLSKTALESTWLFHEIGRCYLEMGKFSKGKDYGEKSIAAANEAEDKIWELNASVLIAQCEVKLDCLEEAVESFERSLDLARVQGDSAAEAAIKKAIEEVNNKIVLKVRGEEGDEEDTTTQQGTEDVDATTTAGETTTAQDDDETYAPTDAQTEAPTDDQTEAPTDGDEETEKEDATETAGSTTQGDEASPAEE